MRVLDVGSGPKDIPICGSRNYDGWQRVRLDLDQLCNPDICMDARDLPIKGEKFDAIYCSHNLEHYYRHDALRVLRGFYLSLNDNGFAHIRVPDVKQVMQRFVSGQLDVESILYDSPAGPITVHDVIYGHGQQIADSGKDFYAHKTGFTAPLMGRMLRTAGFRMMEIRENTACVEIEVFAYLKE